jgi:VanZ family protein
MYFVLTFMLLFESKNNKIYSFKSATLFFICIAFPVVLGGVIEIMQKYLFPPRTCDLLDWFANISGILIAWILTSFYYKTKSFKE